VKKSTDKVQKEKSLLKTMENKVSKILSLIVIISTLVSCSPGGDVSPSATQVAVTPVEAAQPSTRQENERPDPRKACFAMGAMPQISTSDGSEMDRTAITGALFSRYLEQFLEPEMPASYHLTSFAISEVSIDSTLKDFAQEQHVDWAGWVTYSVQAENLDCWIAGNGVLGEAGWVLDKVMIVGVTKVGDVYKLTVHGTGP
jgi:hypothetical protein